MSAHPVTTSDPAPATGLSPRPDLALLRIEGADATAFLQGQFTCDVAGLAPGHWTWGGHCTAKGRLLAVFRLARTGDGFRLQLPAAQAEAFVTRLRRYVLRAKVTFHATGLAGWQLPVPAEAHARPAFLPSAPPGEHTFVDDTDACAFLEADGVGVLHAGNAAAVPGTPPLADIRAGIPWLGTATEDQFIPQMADLDRLGGISFTKGCYPGQEIVARTRYLGTVKRRLHRLHAPSDTAPGTVIETVEGRAVGTVLASAPDAGGCALLAVLDLEAAADPLRLAPDAVPVCGAVASHPGD